MCLGQQGKAIGSYLVGGIAVGGDPVGANEDGINPAGFHDMGGHVIANQCDIDSGSIEFPGGKPGALKERASFVGIDADVPAFFVGDVKWGQGGAVFRGGEASGIAVGEDDIAILQQRGAVFADGAAHAGVLIANGNGFGGQAGFEGVRSEVQGGVGERLHPVQCPEEVYGCWAGGGEVVGGAKDGGV